MGYAMFINWALTFLMNTGSIQFITGSIMYLPQIGQYTLGASLFIVGSASFLICDIIGFLLQPVHSPIQQKAKHGVLGASITLVGNIFFLMGSFFFLPWIDPDVGSMLFIDGCIIIILAQTITFYDLQAQRKVFKTIFEHASHMKIQIMRISGSLALGSILFIPGLILALVDQKYELYSALCYIIGSIFFLLASAWDAKVRHKDLNKQKDLSSALLFIETIHA